MVSPSTRGRMINLTHNENNLNHSSPSMRTRSSRNDGRGYNVKRGEIINVDSKKKSPTNRQQAGRIATPRPSRTPTSRRVINLQGGSMATPSRRKRDGYLIEIGDSNEIIEQGVTMATPSRRKRDVYLLEIGHGKEIVEQGSKKAPRLASPARGSRVINLEAADSPQLSNRRTRCRPKNDGGTVENRSRMSRLKDDGSGAPTTYIREVIELESDSSTSPAITPKPLSGRRRKFDSTDSDDIQILQVSYPPRVAVAARPSLHAACSAAASSVVNNKRPSDKLPVDRIREVFPTLSRSKVESFITMAKKYATTEEWDDDYLVQLVMAVLADDPSGESISEKCFAAAAVGGRLDPNNSSPGTGRQKVAQLECNCCFAEYDFEEMVSCRLNGHLFCKGCLQKHTEQRVFGLGNFGVKASPSNGKAKACEILCMYPDGCTSGFQEGQLRRALSEKVMKKYDELQYQAVVEGANMKDTSRCPKCQYIAFAEETVSTFHCPQCNFKSCRECGEEAHPGIRCDEVETKNETTGRNKVEEAMSNAVIRKCPRPFCRKPFMKTDGCNKITCSCGAFICYICRKEIPPKIAYAHFCQTPHCNHANCNKCGLYADAESRDKIALEKAAKDAAKSVAEGSKVNVDVKSLLKEPSGRVQQHQFGQNQRQQNNNRPRHQPNYPPPPPRGPPPPYVAPFAPNPPLFVPFAPQPPHFMPPMQPPIPQYYPPHNQGYQQYPPNNQHGYNNGGRGYNTRGNGGRR